MWFSQLYLKAASGTVIEVYKEDESGKGVYLGDAKLGKRVSKEIWGSRVIRFFPVDSQILAAYIEEQSDERED